MPSERPRVFAAVCASVSGAGLSSAPGAPASAVAVAHAASVAHWPVAGGSAITMAKAQIERQYAQILGTTGSAANDLPTAKPVGAVRGVPPRGRPV